MSSGNFFNLQVPPCDHRFAYGSDPNQFGDLRLPRSAPPYPVVMNLHGGFWRAKYDLAHAGHMCAALTSRGIAMWNVEYRRVGNPGGGWPGTFDDIRSAYRFLPQMAGNYGLDLNRALVMGHSAGGHLALCLAAQDSSVRRVISLAGVVDLQKADELHLSDGAVVEFLGGTPSEVPQCYHDADPAQLALGKTTFQWLIHGAKDDVVPCSFSRNYVEMKKSKGESVTYVEIPGANHFDLIDPRSPAWKIVEDRVIELLAK